MKEQDPIQNELNSMDSALRAGIGAQPSSVPEGYFEGLAAQILSRVKETNESAQDEITRLSPLLAGINRTMPQSVPVHFFQDNIESLPALTAGEQESLVLSFISRELPYEVPSGYFSAFPDAVLEKIEHRSARVVPITRRKWMRVAAAALVAGVVTIAGISYFGGSKTNPPSVNSPQWVASSLQGVSNKALDEFVQTTDPIASNPAPAHKSAKTDDVNSLLKGVSDKDLDSFLDQVPVDDEESFN